MYSISGLRHDMTITDGVADISTSSNVVMDFANVWESGPSSENPIPIFRLFKDDVNWNSD
jgi:hypothetical protein